MQLLRLWKGLRAGSISRDIVNFPSELRRRRSGMFTEVARLVPPGGASVHRRCPGVHARLGGTGGLCAPPFLFPDPSDGSDRSLSQILLTDCMAVFSAARPRAIREHLHRLHLCRFFMRQKAGSRADTNRSAALFANTLILSGLRAVAVGSRGFMRIIQRRPTAEI